MAWPVVTKASGGIPVTIVTNGLGTPYEEASNGFGTGVTFVAAGGLPVVLGGGLIGGVAIGAAGTGAYVGYTLAAGDDFDKWSNLASKLMGPASPNAPYGATVVYAAAGSRGNRTSLISQYDTDPMHTGYNDANRGVAYPFDNWNVSASVLTLQARKASVGETAMLEPTDVASNGGVRAQVSGMIHTAGALWICPGTNRIKVEARVRISHKTGNPIAWHETPLWITPANPVVPFNGNAWNFEGNSQFLQYTQNIYTSGSLSNPPAYISNLNYCDGNYHTVMLDLGNGGTTDLRVDGSVIFAQVADSNPSLLPTFIVSSCHVYNGDFGDGNYSKANWDADADGAKYELDWFRVWQTAGAPLYVPLISVPDVNLSYNGTTTIVLPSVTALWGDAAATDYLQALPLEANEPGNTALAKFSRFPPGVTYNSGTRTITVDWSTVSGNAGAVHFCVGAWKDGSVCKPLRFTVNRGPFLQVGNISAVIATPLSYDLYAVADCGNILPKTIGVTGLPNGLSYSSSTGLITGTPTEVSSVATITVTNGAGQSVVRSISFQNYQSETNALLAKFTNPLSATKANACDAFIAGCKTDSNWTLLKEFVMLGMDDAQQAKVDWVGSNVVALVGVPTFTADRGYTTNGTSTAIDSGFNVTGNQNNVMLGVYSRTAGQTASAGIGTYSGAAGITLNTRSTTDQVQFRLNDNTADAVANLDGSGCFIIIRDGATSKKVFRNGVQLGSTFTTASSGTISGNFGVGVALVGNSSFCARQFAAFWTGSGVGFDPAAFSTRVTTLLTVFGAN